MIYKSYIVTVVLGAYKEEDLPSINTLVNGINDGLPDDWFSRAEGDDFYIAHFRYDELDVELLTEGPDQMGGG